MGNGIQLFTNGVVQLRGPQHVSGDLHVVDKLATDLYGPVVPNRVQAVAPETAIRLSSRFPGTSTATGWPSAR